MKRIIASLLAVVMMASLSACGSKSTSTAENKQVTELADALTRGNVKKIDKYGDYQAVVDELNISGLSMDDDDQQELVKAACSQLTVTVKSVEEVDDTTKKVNAEVTTKNLPSALDAAVRDMYTYASQHFTEAGKSDALPKKNYEIFLGAINDENLDTVTNTVTFIVKKTDGAWKVQMDKSALNGLLGGFVNTKEDTITNAAQEFEQEQQNAAAQMQNSANS